MTDQMTDARALDLIRAAIDASTAHEQIDAEPALDHIAARLRTLSERQSDVFGYWIPNARACSDGTYADGPGELVLADVASDSVKAHGTPMYAHPALREQQGKPVALLHRDGCWTHPSGKDPFDRIGPNKNIASMPVFAHTQPAAGDAVRALPEYWRSRSAAIGGTGTSIHADELEAALSAAPAPVVPDGWRLVPVIPTDEMTRAGRAADCASATPVMIYRDMLAAAPRAKGNGHG